MWARAHVRAGACVQGRVLCSGLRSLRLFPSPRALSSIHLSPSPVSALTGHNREWKYLIEILFKILLIFFTFFLNETLPSLHVTLGVGRAHVPAPALTGHGALAVTAPVSRALSRQSEEKSHLASETCLEEPRRRRRSLEPSARCGLSGP